MTKNRAWARAAGVCLAAATISLALGNFEAEAARNKTRKGGVLALKRVGVANASGLPINRVIEFEFNKEIDGNTIDPAVIQIRGENATGTGYTKQVFGDFQVAGRFVRFFPRLPTHLRDTDGEFFSIGTQQDNASENSGLQPSTEYEVRVLGRPFVSPVRSKKGRPLRRTYISRFTTAPAFDPAELFETLSYTDSPPPQFAFSNPPDAVPGVDDQYTARGGTKGVPNDISVSLFCTKVPLAPTTARIVGNVNLTMLERKGDPALRRPMAGGIFIEQNFDTTLLNFRPNFPLADLGVYALRVSKDVRDLTEAHDFAENRERAHLRAIYDELAAFRSQQGGPPEALPDPSADLITDWPDLSVPGADAERGILKANLLALGDMYPDEIDPRVMVLFSSRDEPVSNADLRIEFTKGEDLFDAKISTGEVDQSVPEAASAIFTIAGGSASEGDFFPESDVTINIDDYAADDYSINWRNVLIPKDIAVTFTGSRPVTVFALKFELNGSIVLNGGDGQNGKNNNGSYMSSLPPQSAMPKAGIGGPGGGNGGAPLRQFASNSDTANIVGGTGLPGRDPEGIPAGPDVGGQGGKGGESNYKSTGYVQGGGGGGGGAQFDGTDGDNGRYPQYNWDGKKGQGGKGAGANNEELNPLVGGAGGGAGGPSGYVSQGWGVIAGSAAGAAGAIVIHTPAPFRVGPDALISAVGGEGGDGVGYSAMTAGPGGGGGGGTVLLRSTGGFDIANTAGSFDVSGGIGGRRGSGVSTSYGAAFAGDGGDGYLRFESPEGGIQVPGGSSGTYDPVGGGLPSFVYTKFADLGVQDPRILEYQDADVVTDPNTNDAIFVEIQMTREDPVVFGEPDLTAINQDPQATDPQGSIDETITSPWLPLKVHDRSGKPGGAFGIPGYDPGVQGLEYTFPVTDQLNEKGFKFLRLRITFQLDDSQTRTDPLPNVDAVETHFQFNF